MATLLFGALVLAAAACTDASPEATPTAATPPTEQSTASATETLADIDVAGLQALVAAVAARAANGDPVDAALLRDLEAATTELATRIEANPDAFTTPDVILYIQTAANARVALSIVKSELHLESDLRGAQDAAAHGVEVASAYFQTRRLENR
jgi:hypothetical protein